MRNTVYCIGSTSNSQVVSLIHIASMFIVLYPLMSLVPIDSRPKVTVLVPSIEVRQRARPWVVLPIERYEAHIAITLVFYPRIFVIISKCSS